MIWQDVVLGTGQLLFALALIPSLRSPKKPHIATSLLTGVVLMVFAFTFSTLGLWWSCASCALCGGMWIMLGIQVRK